VIATTAVASLSTSTVSGKGITQVRITRNAAEVQMLTAGTWQNIPGATTTVSVPAGASAILLARFTADSRRVSFDGECAVRVSIGGSPAVPQATLIPGTSSADPYEVHSMEASSDSLPAGKYKVSVQAQASGSGTAVWFRNWSLSVMRLNQ